MASSLNLRLRRQTWLQLPTVNNRAIVILEERRVLFRSWNRLLVLVGLVLPILLSLTLSRLARRALWPTPSAAIPIISAIWSEMAAELIPPAVISDIPRVRPIQSISSRPTP